MVALRLTRTARPTVLLRRLLVAAASAGTGFLLLSCFGYALNHPEQADAAALRLAWCAVPLAATAYFALAVARTDRSTRPRPGLSAVGLGPARLMAISALTTALSCTLGSLLALLVFLHLRGDFTGIPFDGAAADFLAAGRHLPVPATLTLLSLVPAAASTTVALTLRPRDPRPATPLLRRYGRFGAYGHTAARETFGAYGRFGARLRAGAGVSHDGQGQTDDGGRAADGSPAGGPAGETDGGGQPADGGAARGPAEDADDGEHPHPHPADGSAAGRPAGEAGDGRQRAGGSAARGPAGEDGDGGQPTDGGAARGPAEEAHDGEHPHPHPADGSAAGRPAGEAGDGGQPSRQSAGSRAAGAMEVPPRERRRAWGRVVADGTPAAPGSATDPETTVPDADWAPRPPKGAPVGLPWGIALLATGLAAQAYAERSALAVLAGWLLTATGLVLAAPGLTHLCGLLLQSTRPGALRLLAGRVLMAEATRIGRPLGVVCAVGSAGYAMTTLYAGSAPAFGPLTTLGALLVTGCTVATLLTAAVESRQCRADTTAALLRLGAPAAMLRAAVALRAVVLLVLFGPLTLAVAALAALPANR
ncbi:hypothetical protein [Streptomyces fodineus]|uniref:hypothetical protein n=1 Tax=Streptomyces fodineus TaxID=1904616 RepID=UPI000AF8CA2F|nr:hypothetical protein [Streptomyces fodineus]